MSDARALLKSIADRIESMSGGRYWECQDDAVIADGIKADIDAFLSLGKSQPALTIEHAHVYDYNRHGVTAFQAPDFQNDEALQLQQLAEAHTPLTIHIYQETTT